MSKPLGTYTDPVFDRLHNISPLADWLGCTVMAVIGAGLLGWMVSIWLVIWLWFPKFDGNANFGWVYLISVAVWVVPLSAWAGIGIWRDVRRGRR